MSARSKNFAENKRVIMHVTKPSGRPREGEFAPYAADDIAYVSGDDAVEALVTSRNETTTLLATVSDGKANGLTYAPGKWTIKEIVGHLIDDERIFGYRALCVARADARTLDGFDEMPTWLLQVSNNAPWQTWSESMKPCELPRSPSSNRSRRRNGSEREQ